MNTSILAQRSTQELLTLIADQQSIINELSMSHLGILAPAAIRRALRLIDGPRDLICIDLRKLHDLNEVLGYDVANRYFGLFARTRIHADTRGQWGGDELIIACAVGDGQGLIMRLVDSLDDLTADLTPVQRQALSRRTGGLMSGFCAVFVLIENSHDVYHRDWINGAWVDSGDSTRGIDECGRLKKGNVTGNRSTSGKPGTIIGTLERVTR